MHVLTRLIGGLTSGVVGHLSLRFTNTHRGPVLTRRQHNVTGLKRHTFNMVTRLPLRRTWTATGLQCHVPQDQVDKDIARHVRGLIGRTLTNFSIRLLHNHVHH